MADDAFLFLLPERHPRLGAALAAVGDLECSETPAVHRRLQAHGVSASSEEVRILPFDAAEFIPEGAEQLPIPLHPDETARAEQACARSRRARRGRSPACRPNSCGSGRPQRTGRALSTGRSPRASPRSASPA
ncbi:DUF6003 family protein [Streptomyces sp. NPDC056194]|uniref:DUF6003 family protein n=1 Tax=Streptomyces sp. NPDC056194 TaxID=3345744 RepID=UPI0035E0175C